MKEFKEILQENIYGKNKVFAKEYDKFHDAMSAMVKITAKDYKDGNRKLKKLWQDIENVIDGMG